MRFKNVIKIALSIVICLTFVTEAYGAGATINIKADENIKAGDFFNIKVSYDGANLSRTDAELKYNTNDVEYISGGDSQGNGGIVLLKRSSDKNGKINFNLKFKALKSAKTQITIDTIELYDMDEIAIDPPRTESSIDIGKANSKTESVDEDTETEEKVETEKVETSVQDKVNDHLKTPMETFVFYAAIIGGLGIILGIVIYMTSKKRKNKKNK